MACTTEQLEYQKAWRAKNKAKVNQSVRAWQARNQEWLKAYRKEYARRPKDPAKRAAELEKKRLRTMLRRYGITEDIYNTMLEEQGGTCALCPRTPEQERYKRLNVDHCHTTNIIRGLLCTPCNHALGVLGDDKSGLEKALKYVTR